MEIVFTILKIIEITTVVSAIYLGVRGFIIFDRDCLYRGGVKIYQFDKPLNLIQKFFMMLDYTFKQLPEYDRWYNYEGDKIRVRWYTYIDPFNLRIEVETDYGSSATYFISQEQFDTWQVTTNTRTNVYVTVPKPKKYPQRRRVNGN